MARPQPPAPKPPYDPKAIENRYPRSLYHKTLLPNTRLVRNDQEEKALLEKGWQEEYVDPPLPPKPLLTEVDIAVDQAQRSARASLEDLKEKHAEQVATMTDEQRTLARKHEAVQNAYSKLLVTLEEKTESARTAWTECEAVKKELKAEAAKYQELDTAYKALQEVDRQLMTENEGLKKGAAGPVKAPVAAAKSEKKEEK